MYISASVQYNGMRTCSLECRTTLTRCVIGWLNYYGSLLGKIWLMVSKRTISTHMLHPPWMPFGVSQLRTTWHDATVGASLQQFLARHDA